MPYMTTLVGDVRAEIVRHHVEIQRWLSGAADPAELETLLAAHHDDLTWIDVGGAVHSAEETTAIFRQAYGSVPGLTIEIAEVRRIPSVPGVEIAAFLERQPSGDRWVTVVFTRDEHGLRWRHLQETAVTA